MNRCSIHSVDTGLSVWAGFQLTCCVNVPATPELDKSDPLTGFYILQTRIKDIQQSASPYLESLKDLLSEIKGLPMGAGKYLRYFSVFLYYPNHCSHLDNRAGRVHPGFGTGRFF